VSTPSLDSARLKAALEKATTELLAERNAQGFWAGELSSSALSTATAVTALAVAGRESQISNFKFQIGSGLRWLAEHQNADGGWGDTTKSLSNISTTTLCWAAFGAAGADGKFAGAVEKAERWLQNYIRPHLSPALSPPSGSGEGEKPPCINIDDLARAIIARYGKDRTFSVPILTMCALAGRLGEGRAAWRHVIPLPFELAACPHQLFAALRLPVVSYALPALIAIGQARHVHAPSRNPLVRLMRNATRQKTLHKLTEIQPVNGGFLEATPLTSFVTMSLAGSGQANHVVAQRGLEFLLKSQRADGSWPIDTNLSTWCTTLTVNALPCSQLSTFNSQLTDWLLNQQYTTEHPYTHAAPGGWAWTDLPGGVPDADDTAGALLALAKMRNTERGARNDEITRAAGTGIRWLLGLQNRDGGIPTFCRGWGALPFDRSSADITAHAIHAWAEWHDSVSGPLQARLRAAISLAVDFLARIQEPGGAFCPLWFGNQFVPDESNRTYGTARVLIGICAVSSKAEFRSPRSAQLHHGCVQWLTKSQNTDGGWGGDHGAPSSVEETALAVEALARAESSSVPEHVAAMKRGTAWLIERVESGVWREPSPIGFYFAKLWYFERLYPMIFSVGALSSVASRLRVQSS
jgi:squalene-hopene/tetraprenyl-beta-curcumene cyclase